MKNPTNKIAERWGGHEELVDSWVPVSKYFLENYHRLKPHEAANSLNSSEAMLIVHLMDFKWGKDAPFPSVGRLATRLGLTKRQTRNLIRSLEGLHLLETKRRRPGGRNLYKLDGLFDELMKLYREDLEENEETEESEETLVATGGQ